MGVIKKKENEIWNIICTTFLVTRNVVASAGICVNEIKMDAPSFQNFEVHLELHMLIPTCLQSYKIANAFHYRDVASPSETNNVNDDIGLIMVSLLNKFYSIIKFLDKFE